MPQSPNTPIDIPAQLLALIERRSAHIASKLSAAAHILLDSTPAADQDAQADGATPTLADIDNAVAEWRFLIPADPEARAQLTALLVERYQATPATAPQIANVLDLPVTDPPTTPPPETPITDPVINDITAELEWTFVGRGDTLYTQGDAADSLFIIVDALVQVVRVDGDETIVVGELGGGQLLGERSLALGENRSSTAHAVRDGDVCRLPLPALERLAGRHPQVMVKLLTQMAQRMSGGAPVRSPQRQGMVTVIVSACDQAVDFAQWLAQDLSLYGRAAVITAEDMQMQVNQVVAGDLEAYVDTYSFVDWMQQQARKHDHILYLADATRPNWTRRCVEQADRILVVGRAGATPELSPVETIIAQMDHPELLPPRELVLLHASVNDKPGDTRAWLAKRTVRRHHHVAIDTGKGVDRVSRFLRGKAIGLVFGGGGMRSAACAGVMRAMEEFGIHADVVGGTSAGAVIAAQYALGWDVDTVIKTTTEQIMQQKVWVQPTLPLVSVMNAKRLNEAYASVYGEHQMEDLWVSSFTISGNLTQAKMWVIKEGLLHKAVRASTSLVGIHPPALTDDGDLLIDGGIFDNTPADIAREMVDTGPVIAVDLGFTVRQRTPYDYGEYLSGWRVLWSRINPFTPQIDTPDLVGMMMRANAMGSINATAEQVAQADLILRPPVSDYGLYDFDAYQEIADAGYEDGKAQISAWLQDGGMDGV